MDEHGVRGRAEKRVVAPAVGTSVAQPWTAAALLLLAAETVGGAGAFVLVGGAVWITAGPAVRRGRVVAPRQRRG